MDPDHQQSPRSITETEPSHQYQPGDHEKTPKPHKQGGYGRYGSDYRRVRSGRQGKAVCMLIVIFLLLAGVVILTLWLVYRPHIPKFRVVSVAVNQLNVTTTPPLLSTTMQFTLVTRNSNRRVSITYDDLSAFVSYKSQAITPPVILPPLFHETKSTVVLSPVIGGSGNVPVADDVVNGLSMEEEVYGVVGLNLVLGGKLRYKGGPVSGRNRAVCVSCDLFVGMKKGFVGKFPLVGSPPCEVNVY